MSAAERRARRLLAAYPWRVRAEQGDEIVATVLDALPPGARRLPWRVQLDLARGGWRVRARRRPPWWTVLAYASGLRIDPRWIGWVFDDLEDPHHVRTRRIRIALVWLLLMGTMAWAMGDPMVVLYGSGGLVGGMMGIARERERRRARHGLVPGGSDPTQVWVRGRRAALAPDVAVAPSLLALGLPLALGGAAWIVAVTHPQARRPDLGATTYPAAPADALATLRPVAAVGGVVGLLLVGLALRPLLGAAGRVPGAARHDGPVARIVTAALGIGFGLAAGAMALVLRWRWASWAYSVLGAALGPVGLGLVVIGVAAGVVGRRRGEPVGLWELAPILAPQRTGYPVARWLAETTPGLEPWDGPDGRGRSGPSSG